MSIRTDRLKDNLSSLLLFYLETLGRPTLYRRDWRKIDPSPVHRLVRVWFTWSTIKQGQKFAIT